MSSSSTPLGLGDGSPAPAAPGDLPAFPVSTLQPRQETGAANFARKYPDYDGRGTIIAVLDTGVDPGAKGLQVTTDGKRKLIDRIDASGAGDIDMSKVLQVKDGKITGLTGRELTIPAKYSDQKEFRVGVKNAFAIYPSAVKDRMLRERAEKMWDPSHKLACLASTRKRQKYERDQAKAAEDKAKADKADKAKGDKNKEEESKAVSLEEEMKKLEKDNMAAELEMLNAYDKKFKADGGDVGSVYDIVLFNDGQHWVTLIDVSQKGDLDKAIVLRPFRETGDFATLNRADQLNISVNVYDEGQLLEIVSTCSPHGTHVAAMSAGHFPGQPELDGLAPGAQVVSITIGDQRLQSMETGTALVRAMIHIMKKEHYKVDLINMSFGEHSHYCQTGRIGSLIGEVVNRHGVIWCVSAGNDGPALSTIGTPPDISTSCAIGVGAYVSPEMMTALYSSRERLPGTPYTWTSRGPAQDGARGVTVCAPGGAITSVPPCSLKGSQLMNGTSMACPHLCGTLSLILSGLKQQQVPYSPFSVRRAIENSAVPLKQQCHFGQGHGLMQVESCFDHVVKHADAPERDVRFHVTWNGNKGIYLRGHNSAKAAECVIKVDPCFLDQDSAAPELKIAFNLKLVLTSSQPWVKCPDFLDLMYSTRQFLVEVDPTSLEPGVHVAYVRAFDSRKPDKGFLFELPVTVVRPEPLQPAPRPHVAYKGVHFVPGQIRRHFLHAPLGASWAVVRVQGPTTASSSASPEREGKFILHALQLLTARTVPTMDFHRMFTVQPNGEWVYPIPVKANYVVEFCLAKWWAHIGSVTVNYSITFHGLTTTPGPEIVMNQSDGVCKVDVTSHLHHEEIQPEIKLKTVVQHYRPVETKLVALSPARDLIPAPDNRPVWELQLTYNFTGTKAGTEASPNFGLLSSVLYESEYESQLWMVYNSRKQLVMCGDAFPSKYWFKLEKDDYVVRLHVRSERREVLEKSYLQDLPMQLNLKMSTTLLLDVYPSFALASTFSAGKKCNTVQVPKGSTVPIYITTGGPLIDKHAKGATPGQYLHGVMSLAKDELGRKVDTVPVKVILCEPPKKDSSKNVFSSSSSAASSSSSSQKKEKTFREALLDHKLNAVSKLDVSGEGKDLFDELRAEKTVNQLQLSHARLTALDLDKKLAVVEKERWRFEDGLELADLLLEQIDADEILCQLGSKNDPVGQEAVDKKKELDKRRTWLLDALCKKGLCLLALNDDGDDDRAKAHYVRMLRYAEPTDSRVVAFSILLAERMGHLGRAIKMAQAQSDAKPASKELEERVLQLAKKLNWQHVEQFGSKALRIKYQDSYELF